MLFVFIGYIIGIFVFTLGDAAIGYGVDFNGCDAPPLALVAILWPLAIPILLVMKFISMCHGVKTRRLEREAKKEKIRIALARDESRVFEEAEQEVEKELGRRMRR